MELINGLNRWPAAESRPLYLALGNFDGVHIGHQAILCTAVEKAQMAKGCSAALIFDPHPSFIVRSECAFALLTDIAERAELISALNLDYCIVEPFTPEIAAMAPDSFVLDILKQKLNVSGVVVGHDYSFGRGGQGNSETMARWGSKAGFEVVICPLVEHNRKTVSSSNIRSLILAGEVSEAAELLNYYFSRRGKVTRGSGIGNKMLYPTANIVIPPGLIQPGSGVYLTAISGAKKEGLCFGVTNVGVRPTFSPERAAVETYILDFEGNLYHREIGLFFLEKLRDTRAFVSPQLLKEQIKMDIFTARELIRTRYFSLPESFVSEQICRGKGKFMIKVLTPG